MRPAETRETSELQPVSYTVETAAAEALGHYQAGRFDQAERLYQAILAAKPDHADSLHWLGLVACQTGRQSLGLDLLTRAATIAPQTALYHTNLGVALHDQMRLEEAVASHRRAIDLSPDQSDALTNLGGVLNDLDRPDEAIAFLERAVALTPGFAGAHYNLASSQFLLRRLEAAVSSYRRALSLQPDFLQARYNLGIALVTLGRFEEGWEAYESRFEALGGLLHGGPFSQPQWRGEAGEGRTLLIHSEQGFGDTLQFCRYAPMAAARGFRVVLQLQRPLVRLLRDLPMVEEVVATEDVPPPFDLHCPMLSLPMALGTGLESIPAAAPYLHADAAAIEAWRDRLTGSQDARLKVGLAWAGSPGLKANARRSLRLEQLEQVLRVKKIAFFSLQKDASSTPGHHGLVDLMDEVADFADTAALIANLDLVITVDTAVAHLAGAMAKPVWLLNRFDGCWRWLDGRRDSPWYPTMRLYNQPRPGDWDSVLADAARDLRALVAEPAA